MTDPIVEPDVLSLTVTRLIKAPPEAVFDAWLNPETLVRFMRPGPSAICHSAQIDPVEGGRFSIVMGEKADITLSGTYREINRPSRLRFTWEGPFAASDSEVTLQFDSHADGTFVTLSHTRFPDAESLDRHDAGWTHVLASLEDIL